MMTKLEISNDINSTVKGAGREIQTNYKIDYQIGQIIETEKPESWTDGGEFTVENEKKYSYVFIVENEMPCHRVKYDENEEYNFALGIDEDCEGEKECIVPTGYKFGVVS